MPIRFRLAISLAVLALAVPRAAAATTRAAVAATPGALPAAEPRAPAVATAEPVFADLAGKMVRVSDRPADVVVLHFWATYCGPCRPEMPIFVRLHDELSSRGVRVIGAAANSRDQVDLVRKFMDELGMRFESWVWVSAKDMAHYGVGPGLPATVVLDRAGAVLYRAQGAADEARLRAAVLAALPKDPAAVR